MTVKNVIEQINIYSALFQAELEVGAYHPERPLRTRLGLILKFIVRLHHLMSRHHSAEMPTQLVYFCGNIEQYFRFFFTKNYLQSTFGVCYDITPIHILFMVWLTSSEKFSMQQFQTWSFLSKFFLGYIWVTYQENKKC